MIYQNKTVQANKASESHSKKIGITIKHYHVDNRIFQDNEFTKAVKNV